MFDWISLLQMAFRLGLGNVNLADAALDALDRWILSDESAFPTCFVNVLSDIALYISGDGNACSFYVNFIHNKSLTVSRVAKCEIKFGCLETEHRQNIRCYKKDNERGVAFKLLLDYVVLYHWAA